MNKNNKMNNNRGRSRSKSRRRYSKRSQSTKSKPTEREAKFAIQTTATSAAKYDTFDGVKKKIVTKLKEDPTMEDVAAAIDALEEIDMQKLEPQLKYSAIDVFIKDDKGNTVVDPVKDRQAKLEQDALNRKYDKELEVYHNRATDYRRGMIAAYAKIYNDYCTKGVTAKLEQDPTFEKDIKDNPVAMLKLINTLAHEGTTATYIWKSVLGSIKRMVNMRMDESEHHNEFAKRVKGACDVVEQNLGPHWLKCAIENNEEYVKANTDDERNELTKKAWKEFQAYTMLHGLHPLKYCLLYTSPSPRD